MHYLATIVMLSLVLPAVSLQAASTAPQGADSLHWVKVVENTKEDCTHSDLCSKSTSYAWPITAPKNATDPCSGIDPAKVHAILIDLAPEIRIFNSAHMFCSDTELICLHATSRIMGKPLVRPSTFHDACMFTFGYVKNGREGVAYVEVAVSSGRGGEVRRIMSVQ